MPCKVPVWKPADNRGIPARTDRPMPRQSMRQSMALRKRMVTKGNRARQVRISGLTAQTRGNCGSANRTMLEERARTGSPWPGNTAVEEVRRTVGIGLPHRFTTVIGPGIWPTCIRVRSRGR